MWTLLIDIVLGILGWCADPRRKQAQREKERKAGIKRGARVPAE